MAYAAVGNSIPVDAWLLVAGNLFWVLAYDTEYAMVDRDDDLKIGMKTSAITLGRWDVPAVMLFYGLFLVVWGVVVGRTVASPIWWVAVGAAAAQVAWHFGLIRGRTREGCFRAFRLNHWVGAALFAGVVLGTW
jgi:4-hydroxybenzoate polyprenyltransferase